MPKHSITALLASVEMNLNGDAASLSAATIRLKAKTYREIKWRKTRDGNVEMFVCEINGTFDELILNDSILVEVEQHVVDGFSRFVLAKKTDTKAAK